MMTVRALEHHIRKDIIRMLERNKKMTVTQIHKQLCLEQSVTSQHLAYLRSVHLVNADRDGKNIFYSLNKKRLKEVSVFLEEYTA